MGELRDMQAYVRACERERETHLVTLKMRSSRRARNTLIPKDVPGLMVAHTTSKILPTITCTHTHTNAIHSCPCPVLNEKKSDTYVQLLPITTCILLRFTYPHCAEE